MKHPSPDSLPSHRLVPMVAAAVAVGAFVGVTRPSAWFWALVASLVLMALAAALRSVASGSLAVVVLLGCAALSGGLAWGAWREGQHPADVLSGRDGRDVLVRGTVHRPEISTARATRCILRVTWMAGRRSRGWEEETNAVGALVMLVIPSPRSRHGRAPWPPPVRWGQAVAVRGVLASPPGPRRPGDFDYASWLSAQDVHHLLECSGAGQVAVLQAPPEGLLHLPWALVCRSRRAVEEAIDEALPYPESGLLRAIVLAEGSALPEDLSHPFRATGTWHVMVTAGLHMNMMLSLCAVILVAARVPGRRAALLCLPVVAFYAALVGGTPSVTRAAIMGACVLLAHAFGRSSDSLTSLGLAVLTMVAWEPRVTHHAGFQMSVTCVLGIALLARPLEQRLGWIPQRSRGTVCVTLATQLAVAPLAALYFGDVSWTGVVANLLVVPACEILLAAGLVLGVGGALGQVLAAFVPVLEGPLRLAGTGGTLLVGPPASLLLQLVSGTVAGIACVPGSGTPVSAPGLAGFVLYYGLLALTMARLSRRSWRRGPRGGDRGA